jgi:hypothetical protein
VPLGIVPEAAYVAAPALTLEETSR